MVRDFATLYFNNQNISDLYSSEIPISTNMKDDIIREYNKLMQAEELRNKANSDLKSEKIKEYNRQAPKNIIGQELN